MADSLEMESIMRSPLKRILPIFLAILILCSVIWYLFVYDREFTRDVLLWSADKLESNGYHSAAIWCYRQAYIQSGDDQAVAIALADQFRTDGNYTQAEATLSGAIASNPSAELYIALSKTYVEQNKLLDAVNMLENITDPSLKAQLEALRPPTPAVDTAAGYYNQYMDVTISSDSGLLYVSTDREYPSVAEDLYAGPIHLGGGETTIYALAVGENGLVSSLGVFGYTIGGVVEPVTLSDPALEAHLRQLLGITDGQTLLTSDLWAITELTVPENTLTLSDLAYLTGLQKLCIYGGSSYNLSVISSLTQLTTLDIREFSLSQAELNAIGSLPNLTELTLSGCGLSSVEALSGLRNLTYLSLSGNTIRDISALSFMTELHELDLSSNAVTNLNAISGLKKLTRLNLADNSVSSLIPLSGCTNLVLLDVSGNALTGLTGIEDMKQLSCLYAARNQLTDISLVAANPVLMELDVSENNLTDISVLSQLKQLQGLNFSHNQVTALPDFNSDCSLVLIDGSYNQLGTLMPLGGLKMLNIVTLDYNNIYWVDPLAKCYNLVRLDIFGNPVSDVSKLTEMGVIVNYSPDV
jgi:Leucine-rich repeat (LRR) protein